LNTPEGMQVSPSRVNSGRQLKSPQSMRGSVGAAALEDEDEDEDDSLEGEVEGEGEGEDSPPPLTEPVVSILNWGLKYVLKYDYRLIIGTIGGDD